MGIGEDDVLMGGYTSYGCDHKALCETLEMWTRRDLSYVQRIGTLSSGALALNRPTVFDDSDYDQLTGAAGDDWFCDDLLTRSPTARALKPLCRISAVWQSSRSNKCPDLS